MNESAHAFEKNKKILSLRTGSRRHLGVPPRNVTVFGRHRELCGLHEVDGDKGRDVGDRMIRAADKWADFELGTPNR